MTKQGELGQLGEDVAARYLKRQNYQILERNCRKKWGEIDIVAVASDHTLVFVEVKTVSGTNPSIRGEDQMTVSKMNNFRRTAEMYANEHNELLTGRRMWRLDLIAIEVQGGTATIRHYSNI